jgi:3-hydroxyisobutyrate dehydrogenase-like beta-hydroxyacid dehydrogenase
MQLGFIGLGNMGSGMAANLIKAGHHLTVYNRTPEKAAPLVALGAAAAARVADACHGDAVISMLADDAAVEGVVFGEAGVLATLPANALHIACGTISVDLSRRLAQAHADAGQPPPPRSCSWSPAARPTTSRPPAPCWRPSASASSSCRTGRRARTW